MPRTSCLVLVYSTLTAFAAMHAGAQTYPAKAVRVIVPFAPGGGSDITGRQVAQKLSEHLGQQFVVDNRGGAGGLIGMELVAKSPPDGYTIMVMSGSFSATAATHKPAFDPINSIIPVAEVGIAPFVLSVHPSVPAKNTREFIALARTTPAQLVYASSGMAGLTRCIERLFCACEPSVWIAKEPQCQRPKIVGKPRRQQPMFDRIVKRNRLIVVCEGFREVAREHQYKGHAALPHHEHDLISLFLGKR